MSVQTLTVEKKKFAVIPLKEYKKLPDLIEDLQNLAEVKKRAKEPRISFDDVRKKYQKKAHKRN